VTADLDAVREALAYVCELPVAGLTADTRLDDVGADSLVRVGVADVVERRLAAEPDGWSIPDDVLGRVATLGELAAAVADARERRAGR
jgi:acyl carrier protein